MVLFLLDAEKPASGLLPFKFLSRLLKFVRDVVERFHYRTLDCENGNMHWQDAIAEETGQLFEHKVFRDFVRTEQYNSVSLG